MGLYLAVFRSDLHDEELDGVEVGPYRVLADFRDAVTERLESGERGSRFPALMGADESDGYWAYEDAVRLRDELTVIAAELGALAAEHVDIEGDPLTTRLLSLARLAVRRGRPIEFH